MQKNATVTVCHSRTKNLEEHTKRADVVISAIGQSKFVKADMVKDGAVVIDVGINRGEDGKLKLFDFIRSLFEEVEQLKKLGLSRHWWDNPSFSNHWLDFFVVDVFPCSEWKMSSVWIVLKVPVWMFLSFFEIFSSKPIDTLIFYCIFEVDCRDANRPEV